MKKHSARLFVLAAFFLSQIVAAPAVVRAETEVFNPTDRQPAALVLGQPNLNTTSGAGTTQTGMAIPYGIAVDPTSGKIFVADYYHHRVLRFPALASLTNGVAAEAVLGQADFTHGNPNRGGGAAANTLNFPVGITVDHAGRLWVADMGNNRVLRYDNASTKSNGADADSVLGQPGFNSSSTATSQSRMNFPTGVFADGSRLWVADTENNRVLRFEEAAAKPNGANADGVLGQADFDTNTHTLSSSGIWGPFSLFLDTAGRLWVTDFHYYRVLRFDDAASKFNGAEADGVLGQEDFTSTGGACDADGMYGPMAISGDGEGRIYVSEMNHRITVFENAAGLANGADAAHVLGQPNFTSCTENAGGISAVSLYHPSGLFFDPGAKVLWVGDTMNSRVLMYGNTAENATQVLGQTDFTSSATATTQTGLAPAALAVDPASGKVFVSDAGNHRVLRFALGECAEQRGGSRRRAGAG